MYGDDMEEKGVRAIVFTIVGVILLIVILSIGFIFKKLDNDKKRNTPTTTEATELTSISCYKIEEDSYTKRRDIKLIYNYGEVYSYELKYTFTYNKSYDADNVYVALNTIQNTERKRFTDGLKTTFENKERGGELTLTYDLTDQNVRMYVNDKYFHNNIYLNKKELLDYLKNRNFVCETELA